MTLTLIVARDRNGAIGRDNTIPWSAPEDLAAFKRETTGGAVIMGRLTWESLPFRPLKGRLNCVVSSDDSLWDHVFRTPSEAVDYARQAGYSRIYGIGGAEIYRALLPVADRLLVTEIDLSIEAPDTFFPPFSESEWVKSVSTILRPDDPACLGPTCVMDEYLRRRPL